MSVRELAQQLNAGAENHRMKQVRIYQAALAGELAALKEEQRLIDKVDRKTKTAIYEAARRFEGINSANLPTWLKNELASYNSGAWGAVRTLEQHPQYIARLIAKIENCQPEDVRDWCMASLVASDQSAIAPMIGNARRLEDSALQLKQSGDNIEQRASEYVVSPKHHFPTGRGPIEKREGGEPVTTDPHFDARFPR